MKSVLPRLALLLLGGTVLLAGCAEHRTRGETTSPRAVSSEASTEAGSGNTVASPSSHSTHAHGHAVRHPAASASPSTTELPDTTGVPACDDYLSSYKACHRAAGIYAPSQLESRYQAMRTSLLRDSLDPDIRPQLSARCNSLASQLRQALHGKSCEASPALPGSTGSGH